MPSTEEHLKYMLGCLEFRTAISNLCAMARKVDESDRRTVERIFEERREIVKLLHKADIPSRDRYDNDYKESLLHAIKLWKEKK